MSKPNTHWLSIILLNAALLFSGSALAKGQDALGSEQIIAPESKDTKSASASTTYIVLGAGAAPYFKGTDQYRAIPFIAGGYENDSVQITSRGLGADINLNPNKRLAYGPIIHWRTEHKHSKANGRARLLDDKDGTLELGGFIGYALLPDSYGYDRLQACTM